jgi:4-amino-4-deoxy-L-arabinose transferase-like glycosyltransferase
MPKPRTIRLPAALLLAALHIWLAASVSRHFSCAFDEPAHLAAGVAYWREGDFRLQPENGLLPQAWLALPLVTDPAFTPPPTNQPAYLGADIWTLGDQILHRLGNDPAAVLARARYMIALLGGALVLVITLWSWSLFGAAGGLASGILAAFSPTLLAHAGLATSDTAGALGYTAALLAYWRLCHRISPARIAVAGLATAGLALAKYSAVLFPLVAVGLLVARVLRPAALPAFGRRIRGARRIPALLAASFAAVLVAWGLVWAAYGFRYAAAPRDAAPSARFIKPWDDVLMTTPRGIEHLMADGSLLPGHTVDLRPGAVQAVVRAAIATRLLPEAWLYGLAFVERHSRFRFAYFAGDWRGDGWLAFFPVAYLLKSTPAEIALHLVAIAGLLFALRRPHARRRLYRCLPLVIGLAVYAGFAVASGLNIGHRHLLPCYALAAILAGAVCAPADRKGGRLRLALTVGLLGLHLGSSFIYRPNYLAYFNFVAGGPDGGHRYLVDSSLDWGQNLPALATWLKSAPNPKPLYLAYFGTDDPSAYSIHAQRIAEPIPPGAGPAVAPAALQPGRYAIGATLWQRVYTRVRGPWTPSYEGRYEKLLAWLPTSGKPGPKIGPEGENLSDQQLTELFIDFDQLRFGRLLHHLRARSADARVAHTWFIYEVDAAELEAALDPGLPR